MLFVPRFNPRIFLEPDFLIPAAIFVVALALRVYGASGSLPYVAHPDEPKLINSATHIVKTGKLNPNLYIWPSFYIYLEALVIRAHLLWGMLRGYYAGPRSLPDVSDIFSLAPGVYVWARTFTAIVGATTATLLYTVGRDMFNGSRRVGVVAALMLTVSPLHIEYSHYALTDVPLGLMGVLVLWASYRLSRTPPSSGLWPDNSLRWPTLLCGLLVGIATGTKYNGLYLMVIPLTAWIIAWRRIARETARSDEDDEDQSRRTRSWPRLLLSIASIPLAALVGFLLVEPYAVIDARAFASGFLFQVGAYLPAQSLGEVWHSVQAHIDGLSQNNSYFLMPAALGAIAMVLNVPVRNRAWLLIPFPVFYLLAMSRFSLTYVRNLIVTLPFLALMAGYLVDLLATQLMTMARRSVAIPNRHVWGLVRWVIVVVGLLLIVAEPFRVSTGYARYMGEQESRNLAWTWMQQEMKQGARFAAELHPWQTQDWPDVLAFDVENPDNSNPLTTRPPEWFANHGYEYVVLNSNYSDNERDPTIWAEYQKLPIVKVFPGDNDKQGGKGPTITVRATSPTAQGADGALRATSPPAMHKSDARVEDFAALEGYDVAPLKSADVLLDPGVTPITGTFKAGEAVGLNLYYRALRDGKATDPNWQVWIHLVDPASGDTVAQLDVPPLTSQLQNYPDVMRQPHPVPQWHEGELLAGVYNFNLPPTLKPGTYHLETGMWIPPNGPGAKTSTGDRITLGEIEVK